MSTNGNEENENKRTHERIAVDADDRIKMFVVSVEQDASGNCLLCLCLLTLENTKFCGCVSRLFTLYLYIFFTQKKKNHFIFAKNFFFRCLKLAVYKMSRHRVNNTSTANKQWKHLFFAIFFSSIFFLNQ